MVTLFTVGHSNRELDAFLATLEDAGIELLVDVRSYPKSRWNRFSKPNLAPALDRAGVRYVHEPRLGGLRDEPYAEHMGTDGWREAFDRVMAEAADGPTAVMCAEREPRRCHRRHIARRALAEDHRVVHLLGPGERRVQRDWFGTATPGQG